MNEPWWVSVIKCVIVINLVMGLFAYLTLAERKVMGRMQLRYGPNRTGPFGLLQPIADLMKLVRKESFFPASAIDSLYLFSPFVAAQVDWWYVVPQLVGFVVFMFAGTAETARAPFDLPEAEQELVAGYHTEYGGMRFGLFTMSEYVNLITLSGLAVTLFLGGWHFPVLEGLAPLWFVLKVFVLLFVFIWLRTTLPRLRYDQLMRFGWKILLPVATVNAVVTAVLVVWI